MLRIFLIVIVVLQIACHAYSADWITLKAKPTTEISRAEIHLVKNYTNPKGLLILCPGVNGDGSEYLKREEWISFAKKNKLDIAGFSFASPDDLPGDGKGYYYASRESGKILLDLIDKEYRRNIPLLLFGFSGGAHFVSRFTEWAPERVLTWCAYSASWWDTPVPNPCAPPGIVACGEEDGQRYGASLIYFKQGRAKGKSWCWVSLAKTGHSESADLNRFVRCYFTALLQGKKKGLWFDADNKTPLSAAQAIQMPALSLWLPDAKSTELWLQIHHP